jgi:hypothetical protein
MTTSRNKGNQMDGKLEPIAYQGASAADGARLSRRSFFMAAGAAGIGAATAIGARPASAQSTDWVQAGNNNHVLVLQGTTAFTDGPATFEYYGHCALKITSPGGCSVLSVAILPVHGAYGSRTSFPRPSST